MRDWYRRFELSSILKLTLCILNFFHSPFVQIDVVNQLQLLTAKPVIYLVNLSERDYVRKKNKW